MFEWLQWALWQPVLWAHLVYVFVAYFFVLLLRSLGIVLYHTWKETRDRNSK